MSRETQGLLGEQKRLNYALRPNMTREEFIREVTTGLVEPPQYFPKNAMINRMGYESIDEVRSRGLHPLSVRAFKAAWEGEKALVLDTRAKEEVAKGYIPGSIFIGLDGQFAPWVGALIPDLKQPILFVAEPGREKEVVTRLARVGYDNSIGYLEGGFEAWKSAGEDVDTVEEISAEEFAKLYHPGKVNVLDVRKISEYNTQHVEGAISFPLDFINKNMGMLDPSQSYYIHCAGGYRSLIAATILKTRGFEKVVNIRGGFDAMKKLVFPLSEYHEQATEL